MSETLQRTTFHCECFTAEHHFFVMHDKEDDMFCLEIKLNQGFPWWKRAWKAFQYFLGRDNTNRTDYEEVLLSRTDREKLAKMLLDSLKENENVRNR